MSKIAMLMVVVVMAASTQCVADCGILPCNKPVSHAKPVENCHHKSSPDPEPPTDHQDSSCGHEQFIGEAGQQVVTFHIDLGLVALIQVNLDQTLPESPILQDQASDRSPPLRSASALQTVLRV